MLDLAKLLYFGSYDGFSKFCRGIGKLVFLHTVVRASFHADEIWAYLIQTCDLCVSIARAVHDRIHTDPTIDDSKLLIRTRRLKLIVTMFRHEIKS